MTASPPTTTCRPNQGVFTRHLVGKRTALLVALFLSTMPAGASSITASSQPTPTRPLPANMILNPSPVKTVLPSNATTPTMESLHPRPSQSLANSLIRRLPSAELEHIIKTGWPSAISRQLPNGREQTYSMLQHAGHPTVRSNTGPRPLTMLSGYSTVCHPLTVVFHRWKFGRR